MWSIKRKSHTNNWHNVSRNSHYFVVLLTLASVFSFALVNNTSAATYTASLSTSGVLSVDATSNGSGTSVGVDTLTVNSTCPAGYAITIEGPSDTNLYLNGNSANNANGTYIAHSTGTPSNPVPITGNNLGTWGYSTTSSTGSGNFIGLTNTATTLTSKNSASASGGDTIPVYYGVSVPTGLTPGTYQMPGTSAITYYLTRSDNCVSYLVSFNANGGSGTAMPDQRIYEDQATPLSTNTYAAPSGKIFKEWNTAADGSGTSYQNEEVVTNIATVGTTLPLYAIWITPIYMQDMDFSECKVNVGTNGNAANIGDNITVYDKRDMKPYTVRYINGQCWMTRNLAVTGTVSAADSNFTGSDFNVSQYSLDSNDSSYTNHCNSTNIYNYACAKESGNNNTGVWYNYYAASAGTISTNSSSVNATSDICPAKWHLPSGPNSTTGTDLNDLVGNTLDDGQITTGLTAFGGVVGGNYYSGSIRNTSQANWWTSTVGAIGSNTSYRYKLLYDSSLFSADTLSTGNYGYFIRCVKDDPSLYRKIEKMNKGKQTNDTNTTTGIKVNPTAPTSSVTVSPNSGVYEYDSSVFGEDSDGTKSDGTKAKIYYYHGILDSYGNTNTYGSAGNSDAYPNYVILQTGGSKATTDTCWRIIRTTGSGGVKMIYNGTWTGSTCANSQANAMIKSPVTTSTFNGTASTAAQARQAVRVGYTHNSTYATTTSSSVAVNTLFGSDSNFSVNNGDSTIKGNIETWFNNTLSVFDNADMFESNANYCNDRSAFQNATGTTATTNLYSYTTSTSTGTTYRAFFGPYVRNATSNKAPSLGCSRSTVDRYSTDTTAGGNGQLGAPVGLITADEASFAGSGSNTAANGSGYSSYSFLRNGSTFWTMSPYYRSGSYAYDFYMNANGYMTYGRIDSAYGVRPAISLKEGTPATSGTGIATDPWVVKIYDPCDGHEAELYCKVKQEWKDGGSRVQTNDDNADTGIRAEINTSNSGVFKYDSATFGTASDASDERDIFYYRGILDSNLSGTTGNNSYGSNGDGVTWPNYVRIDNHCWRIVRTTGSGGVKLIYNGLYNGGTATNTCANAGENAVSSRSAFDSQADSGGRTITSLGYTYDSTYNSISTSTAYGSLFGTNTSFSNNTTQSTIKKHLENNWFYNISSYWTIMEPSAGYCNDRTLNTGDWTTPMTDTDLVVTPYTSSTSGNTIYHFGAYIRAKTTQKPPTLSCPRQNADLYTAQNATNGNNQLNKPIAMLTTDEAVFAGSGYSSSTTPYHSNSFLRAGYTFWLMSPSDRDSDGVAYGFRINTSGYLDSGGRMNTNGTSGVRPVISLQPGTRVSSGSGTAVDPWVIDPILTMQNVTSSDLATIMPNVGDRTVLTDVRDGQKYTISKLPDNKYWMLKNLNIAGGTTLSSDTTDFDPSYSIPETQGWLSGGTLPNSSTTGFSNNNYAYVYNSNNDDYYANQYASCADSSTPCYSYYSWDAATLGSGRSITTDNTDAPYSICPKGWRLPNTRTGTDSLSDYRALMISLGGTDTISRYHSSTSPTGRDISYPLTTGNIFFRPAGNYNNSTFYYGSTRGYYWSSTAQSSASAHELYILEASNRLNDVVDSAEYGPRGYGASIRCVFRGTQ